MKCKFIWYYFLICVCVPLELIYMLAMIIGYIFGWKYGIYPNFTEEGFFSYVPVFDFDAANKWKLAAFIAAFLILLVIEILLIMRKRISLFLLLGYFLFQEGIANFLRFLAEHEADDYFGGIFWRYAVIAILVFLNVLYFKKRSEYFGAEKKTIAESMDAMRRLIFLPVIFILVTGCVTCKVARDNVMKIFDDYEYYREEKRVENQYIRKAIGLSGDFVIYPDRVEVYNYEIDEDKLLTNLIYFRTYNSGNYNFSLNSLEEGYLEYCRGDEIQSEDVAEYFEFYVDRERPQNALYYYDYLECVDYLMESVPDERLRYVHLSEICRQVLKEYEHFMEDSTYPDDFWTYIHECRWYQTTEYGVGYIQKIPEPKN